MLVIKSKSKEFFILALLLNIGAYVLLGFLFMQIKSANERTSTLLNQVASQSKEEDTLKALKAFVQETAPLHTKLDTYFVSPEGVADFIDLLESIGRKVGVAVTILSVEKIVTAQSTEVEVLSLRLSGSGSWEDVVRFLGILEFLPYQTTIGQLVFSRTQDEWRIDLTMSVLKEK